jgi:hypothetical protein
VAVERDALSHVGQVVRSLNDPAAVISSISQSRDFAALFVSHASSLVMHYLQRQPVKHSISRLTHDLRAIQIQTPSGVHRFRSSI